VTNKLGLPCLLCKYAGQIDLLRRRRLEKGGGYHSQLCQQDGKQNAAYAQFRPTTKFTAKYMQISGRYIDGKRHTPRKQYKELLGAKLKRD